jgi:hypothetical protein
MRAWIMWTGSEWRDALERDGYACDVVAPEMPSDGALDPRLRVLTRADYKGAVETRHRAFEAMQLQRRPPDRGRTIREAVTIALEVLPGSLPEFVAFAAQRDAMRAHVLRWCHEYAATRGVILSDQDITTELDAVIVELKGRR